MPRKLKGFGIYDANKHWKIKTTFDRNFTLFGVSIALQSRQTFYFTFRVTCIVEIYKKKNSALKWCKHIEWASINKFSTRRS